MRTVDPVRHAARRRQILAGAGAAFAAKGYDGATVKDVCAAAGVGSGTVFHYFTDKRAILHALLEEDRDRLGEDLARIAGPTAGTGTSADANAAATTALWAVVDRATADLHDPAAGMWTLAILGQLAVDPRVGQLLAEADEARHGALRARIGALQGLGAADPAWPADDAARWVGTVIDGLFLRCADDGFDAPAEVARLRIVVARMLQLREAT